ncbi:MAG: MBL fold metallo-hydrolase [Rickettsiaceae bacterium]|nr:MBL fold metallo-hydrolase [Rickettsiaceae bacterium]
MLKDTKYYEGEVSDHFDGKSFFDPSKNREASFYSFLKWQFNRTKNYWPAEKLPSNFDVPPERVFGSELRVSNVGHVTYLIQTQGINILTDPVWSERASPIPFMGPKRVVDPGIKFSDLPPIDIVLISHNHYDHLDVETIDKLWQAHHPRIITPLGNDTIIKSKNPTIKVEAYDWGDTVKINDLVNIHLDPMQHWSARGLFDRNKALWAAFTIETIDGNIYFIGDSGYGEGRYFKAAKEKYDSFRLVLLPIGAYNPRWFMQYAHMDPEQAILAYIDLGMPNFIPGHYDVFKLTDEPFGEALTLLEAAKEKHQTGKNIKVLRVGEFYFVP